MKIHSTDSGVPVSNKPVNKIKKEKNTGDFNSVLKGMIEKSNPSQDRVAQSIPPLMGALPTAGMRSEPKVSEFTFAHSMLDKLDRYQQMLADPAATLRMIQPVVTHMEEQIAGAEKVLGKLPEDHPLTKIIRDTIMYMSQEISRFSAGYYVDDQFTPLP